MAENYRRDFISLKDLLEQLKSGNKSLYDRINIYKDAMRKDMCCAKILDCLSCFGFKISIEYLPDKLNITLSLQRFKTEDAENLV